MQPSVLLLITISFGFIAGIAGELVEFLSWRNHLHRYRADFLRKLARSDAGAA